MKKIPVAKISNKTESINIFAIDYWEDIDADKKPPAPYTNYDDMPEYAVEGDEDLRYDFLIFVHSTNVDTYQPYPWSTAMYLSERFAKENNLQYEDTFPQELQEAADPNKIY